MAYKGLKRRNFGDLMFDGVNSLMLIFVVIVTLLPFLNILAISFNEAADTMKGGVWLWPRLFSMNNFNHIFNTPAIPVAFRNSVLRTVITSLSGVFLTAMLAYTLTRKTYVLRNFIMITIIITMYIDGGLIPTYFLMRDLRLIGTFLVYIIPGLIHPFNLLVIRTYMNSLPDSFVESAKIDGAGEFRIFLQIIMPLCLPVLATVTLFIAVGQWNSWFDNFLYNSFRPEYTTMQFELMKLLESANAMAGSAERAFSAAAGGGKVTIMTPTAVRAAMTIVTAVPILLVYPFLQKYFVKGLTLGGVKA